MTDKLNTSTWTYEDFLAYVLLYAANANLDIDQKEKNLIIKKVGKAKFAKAFKSFSSCNDYERLQTILSFKSRFFPSEDEKNKILTSLKEIFFADGKFDQVEQSLLLCLKRFM